MRSALGSLAVGLSAILAAAWLLSPVPSTAFSPPLAPATPKLTVIVKAVSSIKMPPMNVVGSGLPTATPTPNPNGNAPVTVTSSLTMKQMTVTGSGLPAPTPTATLFQYRKIPVLGSGATSNITMPAMTVTGSGH